MFLTTLDDRIPATSPLGRIVTPGAPEDTRHTLIGARRPSRHSLLMALKSAEPITMKATTAMTTPINTQINIAFAQFDLFGFVVLPNAQTRRTMMLTIGIDVTSKERNQSPILTVGETNC